MTLNGGSNQDIQTRRREMVAQLRLRGLTVREIAHEVSKHIVNPNTEAPFTHVTIQNDLQALEAEWKANAFKATGEHVARQLAEVAEVKRAAWSSKELTTVLSALTRESKLLGLDAPEKHMILEVPAELTQALIDALRANDMNPAATFEAMIRELHERAHTANLITSDIQAT